MHMPKKVPIKSHLFSLEGDVATDAGRGIHYGSLCIPLLKSLSRSDTFPTVSVILA
jgi:hypothetical protein